MSKPAQSFNSRPLIDRLLLILNKEMARIGESKKIIQLWHIAEEQILVILCGKQRHVRLLPIRALEATDVEWIKVTDSKNCITACTGIIRRNPQIVYCIVIALKRPNNQSQIIVYEVNRNRTRHHKMCEFTVAYPVQSLQILSDMRLAVGHQSGFTAYFLQGEAQAMCKLPDRFGALVGKLIDLFLISPQLWSIRKINCAHF